MEKKILVVDDDNDTREYILELLNSAGYIVATCGNADSALRLVDTVNPFLVITDWRLPDKDGLALLGEIKSKHPSVNVLVISAYGDWDVWSNAISKGAIDLVLKPFKSNEFLGAVRRIFEGGYAQKS